ncbi:Sperm-tail PG-rich repeat [Trypanosoma melophagium]|uniref:Sperm-tail PG-rich repeat n=1 Tax=Trypanosoma melophagium TaxID=715481 RepID=UPI003519FE24|nr:Sperm-tail PG-rich repeat [Trypanosoma melophagium]
MDLPPEGENVYPGDVQAQVDELYAHILASVDVSLDDDAENSRSAVVSKKSLAVTGNTQRRSRWQQGVALVTERRSKLPIRGVCEEKNDAAVAAACCCCYCGGGGGSESVDNISPSVAFMKSPIATTTTTTNNNITPTTTTGAKNEVDGCLCSCHHSTLCCVANHTLQAVGEKRSAVSCLKYMSKTTVRPSVTAALPQSLRRQPPSTFGSGRKGMSEPVKKNSTPGPGSYFCNDDNEVYEKNSGRVHRRGSARGGSSGSGGHQETQKVSSVKEEAVEVLKRQFTLTCQCYWKQFPELEIPTNPSAHAATCPCQHLRTTSMKSNDSSRSSQSRCTEDSLVEVNNRKQRTHAIPVVISPRRGVCTSTKKMRGAVFGTSPRRTIFAEQQLLQHGEQAVNEGGKQIPQQGTKSIEKIHNISRSGKDSALRNKTPSRKPLLGVVDAVPGPGAYNIFSDFDLVANKSKTGGVSIGRAARNLHTMTESPGPGAYSTDTLGVKEDKLKKKNYFLTTSPRRLQLSATKNEEAGPGPGEYRTEKALSSDARHKNAPAFSFGRAKLPECAKMLFRASPAEKVDDIPGPGTYDVSTVSRETGAPVSGRTAIITTAKRNDNMWRGVYFEPDDVPGPGTYTVEKEERGPAYSLRVRPTEHTETTPGPGEYVIPNESTGPQWTMSARRSSPEIREPSPGPGDYFVPIYDLRREHSKAPLFTTAPRLLHADTDETAKLPGPGNYDIVSSIDASRTAVMGTAVRAIMPECESSEIPGPGAYMVQHTTQERRVAVPLLGTTSPRFENETVGGSVNPDLGPGYYDSDIHTTLLNQRSAILGSAPRTLSFISQAIATDAGPGSYEIVVPKDGLSFSIRQRLPDNSLQEETTPGPGLYDMHELSKGRSAVVGSAARFQPNEEKSRNEVPGPGAYTTVVPATSSSPAVFFGTSPRMLDPAETGDNFNNNNNNNNNNLGPGDYDPQDIRGNISGAAWGKGLRFTEDGNTEVPGPGAYEILSFSPVRNVVFGTAREKSDWLVPSDTSDQPGPGSYLPQDPKERGTSTVVFGSSPQHTLSPEERENLLRTNLGPGAYDAILPTPHAFHATFVNTKSGRTEEIPLELTPGPGQYSPDNANILPSRSVVFGTASRNQIEGEGYDIPGPGAYAPMDAANGVVQPGPVTFSSAARFGNTELGGSGNNGNKSDTPGPGAYFVERYMKGTTSGAVVIGTGPRFLDHEQRERAQLPGPGQYKPDDNVTMTRTSVYTFPTEPRMAMNEGGNYNNNNNTDVPGPGAYDVAVPTFTAPTTRFGTEERKMVPTTQAEVPGPGAYDITGVVRALSSAGPSYLFPTASRELPANSGDTPGPGQYEGNLVETFSRGDTKAPSFPTGPRFSEVKNENLIPGPGQYTPSHPQWEASKVYSFSTGSKQQPLDDEVELPGPGTYSPNQILPSSVAPTFGTEPRRIGSLTGDFGNVNNNNNIPGPGYYNVTLPPGGPSICFGVAPRVIMQNNNDEGAPGPGTYDVVLKTPEGPAVSLHRTASRGLTLVDMENSQIPGPGAYSVPPVFPATEGSGAAISFLKAERFQIPESTEQKTPGPGFYSPQYLDQTTGCFIGRAPRLAEVSDGTGKTDIPGPGHYEVYRHDTNFESSVDGGVAMRFTASRFAGNGEGNTSEIPGPASYNISETLNTGTAISFPQAARFAVSELNNAAMQPGPGEYSIPSSWQQQQGGGGGAVGYSFGTSTRMDSVTAAGDTPGPGSYDASRYAARFMTGPAFTLHGKPTYVDEKEAADYPGPGAYSPRPVETVLTTSFGVPTTVDPDAVFAAHVNSTPGPGTYVIPQTLSQQTVTFGTAERMTEVKEDHPGPGAYLTGGPVIVSSQPAFSFGNAPRPEMVSSTQSNLPGPGEYHHPIDPKPFVPAFTFAGAERFNDMENLGAIGPGQYYNVGTTASHDGRAFSFPKALRTVTTATATSTGNIGPGEYFHSHRWGLAERGPTFPIQDASTSINNKR